MPVLRAGCVRAMAARQSWDSLRDWDAQGQILRLLLSVCGSQTVKLFQTPLPVIPSMLKRLEICRQQSDSWTARRNITWVGLRAGALLAVNWNRVLIEDPVLPPCAEVWEQQAVPWALAVCHIAGQWQRNAFCICLYSSRGWSTVPLHARCHSILDDGAACDSKVREQGQWYPCWNNDAWSCMHTSTFFIFHKN